MRLKPHITAISSVSRRNPLSRLKITDSKMMHLRIRNIKKKRKGEITTTITT